MYPGFLQHTGFVAMNPDRHATSHYDYFKNLIKGDDVSTEAHRKFYDEYNAVLDMDADYYLETIATVFQDFKLVNGTWDVKNAKGVAERVKPQDIKTTALLTVEGELDDISGSGQTEAAHGLCSGIPASQQKHLEAKGAGHYGIFSGRRWRDVVYPEVKRFILSHNTKASQPKQAEASVTPAQVAMEFAAAPVAVAAPAVAAAVPPAQPAKVVVPPAAVAAVATAAKAPTKAPLKATTTPKAAPVAVAVAKPVTVVAAAPAASAKKPAPAAKKTAPAPKAVAKSAARKTA